MSVGEQKTLGLGLNWSQENPWSHDMAYMVATKKIGVKIILISFGPHFLISTSKYIFGLRIYIVSQSAQESWRRNGFAQVSFVDFFFHSNV